MADSDDECSEEQASSIRYWNSKIEKEKRSEDESGLSEKQTISSITEKIRAEAVIFVLYVLFISVHYWISKIIKRKGSARGDKPITKIHHEAMNLYDDMKYGSEDDYLISSYFSLLLDPLFLYIIIIKDDSKCLMFDETLMKIAIVLRVVLVDLSSVPKTAIRFVSSTLRLWAAWRIRRVGRKRFFKICASVILDMAFGASFFLPIPQLVILVFFPAMRGSRSLNTMKILNSLIVLLYVARVLPIYKFCKRLNMFKLDTKLPGRDTKLWVPAVVNFILYILAIHVLGAFWYFFALQRQIYCWGYACESENRCEYSYFDCDHSTLKNITLLNDLCPINPPNTEVFDFGIFLGALQSGILGSTDFSQKFLQCFSWGLRNLSSFASNLNTSSTYAWETLFVIFISICGLLLFIYLLGQYDLQIFMQETDKSYRIWLKMRIIDPQIEVMLSEYGLRQMRPVIFHMVLKSLEDHEDLVVDNVFSILPSELKEYIKRRLFLRTLTDSQIVDKKVLKEICKNLQPVMHTEGSYIIQQGEPLDKMLFITQGIVMTYTSNNNIINGGTSTAASSSTISRLEKRDSYGKQLIDWACAAKSTSFSDLPISERTLKAHKKVEVFAIMASDLQLIVSKSKEPPQSTEIDQTQQRSSTDRIDLAVGNV